MRGPPNVIDKVAPNQQKFGQELPGASVGPIGPPKSIRETKNNQLFEKYMHNRQHNRKVSVEMSSASNMNSNASGVPAPSAVNDYAMPSSNFALPTLT